MRDRVAVLALLALLLLAGLGTSAVMAVSVVGMAAAWWATRSAGLGRTLAAVAVAAVAAALAAEAVHTLYHRLGPVGAAGDAGGFWVGATLVGLIDAAAFAAALLLAEGAGRWRAQRRARRSSAS